MSEPTNEQTSPDKPRWRPVGRGLWALATVVIVPVVLVWLGHHYSAQQADSDHKAQTEELKHANDLRARSEQARNLRLYFTHMRAVALKYRKPADLQSGGPANAAERALTLEILPQINADGKSRVLAFLLDAGLLQKDASNGRDPMNLYLADFERADLHGRTLIGVTLEGADLAGADFSGTTIHGSSYEKAVLKGARFDSATLTDVLFDRANLTAASLRSAKLTGFNTFRRTCLTDADLSRLKIELASTKSNSDTNTVALFKLAQGARTDFSSADLRRATFAGARLREPIAVGTLGGPTTWDSGRAFSGGCSR